MSQFSRRRFLQSSAAGVFSASGAGSFFSSQATGSIHTKTVLEDVNLGYISCGGRAGQLMSQFDRVDGVNVVGLCDPDESQLGKAKERYPKAKGWSDLRGLLDDESIDAVVISTCNHWHCLAAIMAMEAGKDVYVEKPLSHSQWEGEQTVKTARKLGRVCQVGTQQRSDPMQAEIKKFLHEEKALGEIQSARVNRYGVRGSIGKRETPLAVADNVDMNLWLGPAANHPLMRNKLQYDWHWDWNTGSGEMGNWGVHVLDDVRNNVFLDKVTLPKRIFGGGGRVVWDDAGNTPNVHFVYFDTGSIPVVIGLSNLTKGTGEKGSPAHPGPGSGYVAYCEGGRYEGQRGRGVAFDSDGKKIKEFRGNNGDRLHQQNFIDAVRLNDAEQLNTEVEIGHHSTGWCNLANIAFRTGKQFTAEAATAIDNELWSGLVGEMKTHLAAHEIELESSAIRLGPVLSVDPKTERFVGDNADDANAFIRREYRKGFEVKEVTS